MPAHPCHPAPMARALLVTLLALACRPPPADVDPPAPDTTPAPYTAHATEASAGGERCTVSRPTDLGATLTVRGGPSDVRLAAGPHGGLVAWMQPHPTKPVGRLVAVRPLDRRGRPVGVVQTLQPPIGSVLKDIVADDGGYYVLVQAPDQPRANHAIALRPDGAGVGAFVEIAGAGGLAPLSRGPAQGPHAAVLYGPAIGGQDALWVALARTDAGVAITTRPLGRPAPAPADAHAWVAGDGRPALLLVRGDARPELLDGDVLLATAALSDGPPLGLDAAWRGDAIDLVWTRATDDGASLHRALLRPTGALEPDPPGLPAFALTIALELSADPLRADRHTRAGRPLAGLIDLAAADPEHTGALPDTGWTWTGDAFVIGYPARTAAGVTTRTVAVTCPQ